MKHICMLSRDPFLGFDNVVHGLNGVIAPTSTCDLGAWLQGGDIKYPSALRLLDTVRLQLFDIRLMTLHPCE